VILHTYWSGIITLGQDNINIHIEMIHILKGIRVESESFQDFELLSEAQGK
jgi:hypothetical protein